MEKLPITQSEQESRASGAPLPTPLAFDMRKDESGASTLYLDPEYIGEMLTGLGIESDKIGDLRIELHNSYLYKEGERGHFARPSIIRLTTIHDDIGRANAHNALDQVFATPTTERDKKRYVRAIEKGLVTKRFGQYLELANGNIDRVTKTLDKLYDIQTKKQLESALVHEVGHYVDYLDPQRWNELEKRGDLIRHATYFYNVLLLPAMAAVLLAPALGIKDEADIGLLAFGLSIIYYTAFYRLIEERILYEVSPKETSARRFGSEHKDKAYNAVIRKRRV